MFDRSAITEGRCIQDFGLCDLGGVYLLTAKMRAKGWLVVTFFNADDPNSASTLEILTEWSTSLPSDKVAILGVLEGERSALDAFKAQHAASFPVVWDIESYWADNWGLNSLPTTFVTDTAGRVLDRIVGADTSALAEAKSQLSALIEKAAAAAKAAAEAAAAAQAAAPAPPAPAPALAPTPAPVAAVKDAPKTSAKHSKDSSKSKSGKK